MADFIPLLIVAELCATALLALRWRLQHQAAARPVDARLEAMQTELRVIAGILTETRRMVDDDRTRRALGQLK